tara:strand:- start:8940 stop:9956 length:1017 start_codon:yes stop_codon:yes gene_type:complete
MLDKLLNTSPQYGIVAPQSNVIPENPLVFEEGTMTGGQLDWTIAENPVLPNLAGTLADALIVWGELDEKRQAMKVRQAETELAGQEAVLEQTLAMQSTDYFQSKEFNRFRQNQRPDIPGVDTPFEVQTEEEAPRVSMAAMEDLPQETWTEDMQANYIRQYEGVEASVYTDTAGKRTIGIGHNLDAEGSPFIWQQALPNVSREDVISGARSLTDKEVDALYRADLREHRDRTIGMFPELETYPPDLQVMLIDGVYQGFFKSSHNTTKAIRERDWCRAAANVLKGSSPRGYRTDYEKFLTAKEKGMAEGKPESNYTTVKRYDERKRLLDKMCAASKKGEA